MELQVWIASHIHSAQRFEWFTETIRSILNQKESVDKIFISYSQEDYVIGNIEKIFDNEKIHFMKKNTRHTQFEHLKSICDAVVNNTKTFVLFCDDDDLYHEDRISMFKHQILENPNIQVFRDNSGGIWGSAKIGNLGEVRKSRFDMATGRDVLLFDFGNYVVDLSLIKNFFTEYTSYHRSEPNFAGVQDLVFTSWLKENYEIKIIEEFLYYKRSDPYMMMRYQCWDLDKSFDFKNHIEPFGLDKIFYSMNGSNQKN